MLSPDPATSPARGVSAASADARRTRFRWAICGLLFLATTINYADRQILGVLKLYLVALAIIHPLNPRHEPMRFATPAATS